MGADRLGRTLPKGNVVPHAGFDADGHLTQWTCLTGDHDGLTPAEREAAAVAARATATDAWLAGLDLNRLAEALAGPLAAALKGQI